MKNEDVQGENKKGIFHEIFYVGFKDAVKSSLGIFKIMLPVSLLMAILNYLGIADERDCNIIQHGFVKPHPSSGTFNTEEGWWKYGTTVFY